MTIDITDLPSDPIDLFAQWYKDAEGIELREAMAVATASPAGSPSNRFVLLKQFDQRGFVFFTNAESRKGQDLAANPQAAAVIFWKELRRQVRIEGTVERVSDEESDAYFQSRDRLSQIGATVSPQSRIIASRSVLDEGVDRFTQEWAGQDIPRPAHWGGYRIIPRAIEYWIGREARLHDRFRYMRAGGRWWLERLAP